MKNHSHNIRKNIKQPYFVRRITKNLPQLGLTKMRLTTKKRNDKIANLIPVKLKPLALSVIKHSDGSST